MEQAVKQRLTGLAVLTALAIVVLPVVFNEESALSVQVSEPIPARPPLSAIQTIAPVPVAPAREQAIVPISRMYKLAGDTSAAASEESADAVALGGQLDEFGIPLAWLVRVAVLSDEQEARQLVDQLRKKGYASFAVADNDAQERVNRVFVGPKLDKNEAIKIKQKLDKEMGIQTSIVPFAPE